MSHCGGKRVVDRSDVRFPSSLGFGARELTHAMCNNKKVVPSCFIPVSAALCAGCRHRLHSGKTLVGTRFRFVSTRHGR